MLGLLVKPVTLASLRAHIFVAESEAGSDKDHGAVTTGETAIAERLLRIANGDSSVALRLVDLFRDELDRTHPLYLEAMQKLDRAAIRQYAHHNKGPARMLGLTEFADACDLLMTASNRSQPTDADGVELGLGLAETQRPFTEELAQVHRQLDSLKKTLWSISAK